MPDAPPDRALELVDLAAKLKLTSLQADFVLALVADPKGNQTKAAIEAGASSKTAHIWASKTLRLAKVQDFLAKVVEAASERARERALASPAVRQVEEVIMEAAEHQLRLSRMGRADIGRHLAIDRDGNVEVRIDPAYTDTIRELRVEEWADKDGMPVRRTTIKVADPVPALEGLARVKGWDGAIPGGEVNQQTLDFLGAVPVQLFKEAYLRLISEDGGDPAGRWAPMTVDSRSSRGGLLDNSRRCACDSGCGRGVCSPSSATKLLLRSKSNRQRLGFGCC